MNAAFPRLSAWLGLGPPAPSAEEAAAAPPAEETSTPMEVEEAALNADVVERPRCAVSDLRLLQRKVPALRKLNLSHASVVTDEWLEVLATEHCESLVHLDLTGCTSLSSSSRPLAAIKKLKHLEVLRLPAERWKESDLADALIALPRLSQVDSSTRADLSRERDALRMQCEILGHVQH